MENQKKARNGKSRMVDWFIDKVLAKAVIGLFGASLGLVVWQVKVDAKMEALQVEITEIKATIKQMKARMDRAMETGPAGHMTHREYNLLKQENDRRLEVLEQNR